MFPQPLCRIVWKEYRVQRPLWLICLAIGVTLQVWTFLSFTSEAVSLEIINNRWRPLAEIAAMMSVMYAIGCAAILFAGEREEQTSDWLLTLSTPPVWTLAAKLFCAIGSIVGLQAILSFPGLMISGGSVEQISYFVFSFYVLVWAVLGSLVSRRVLISIGAMIGYWVLTYLAPVSLTHYFQEQVHQQKLDPVEDLIAPSPLTYSLLAIVLGADLWLGWRWCQGKYLDGGVVESSNAWLASLLESRLGWTSKTRRLPRRAEHGQPWRRCWQRLIWQERHRERGHHFILVLGVLLAVSLGIASKAIHDSAMMPAAAFVLAIPVAMGVLGFRADSGWQQPRFLCDRGIASGSVWLAKQIVWLPRAFVITGVVFVVSSYCEWLFVRSDLRTEPFAQMYHNIRWNPGNAATVVLIGYCSGQLAACIFRRVIVAAFLGIALNSVAWAWARSFEAIDLPLWLSVGLPIAAMLLVSLWQTTAWLRQDDSWNRIARLTTTAVAIPVLLIAVAGLYRSVEIRPAGINQKRIEEWNKLRFVVTQPLSTDGQSVRKQLMELMATSRDQPDQRIQSTDEIVSLLHSHLISLHDPNEPSRVQIFKVIHKMVRDRALELSKSGEIGRSLSFLLADLKLSRLAAERNTLEGWWTNDVTQRETLEAIVELGNHPAQTVDSIRQMMAQTDAELMRFPGADEAIVASYVNDCRNLVDSSTSQAFQFLRSSGYMGENKILAYCSIAAFRERSRLHSLLTRESQLAFTRALSLEFPAVTPVVEAIQTAEEVETARWARTTLLMRCSSNPLWKLAQKIHDRVAMTNATLARLAIISYRIEHGRLPAGLMELNGLIDGKNLIDPFSNRLFDYYPAFLLSAGPNGIAVRLNSSAEAEIVQTHDSTAAAQVKTDWFTISINQLSSAEADQVSSTITMLADSKLVGGYAYPIPPKNSNPHEPKD